MGLERGWSKGKPPGSPGGFLAASEIAARAAYDLT
jgi:hypothetical protein